MSRTLLHLSDLHFGRVPPGMAETLVEVARRLGEAIGADRPVVQQRLVAEQDRAPVHDRADAAPGHEHLLRSVTRRPS